MTKNRRAQSVLFGFDFQVNAAIVLMLENLVDLKSIKLEGNYEDIELILENNEYLLVQAKSVECSSTDFRNVRSNLKKALHSLSEGAEFINVIQLIFITNSPNPLNDNSSLNLFYGNAHREYNTLPISSKTIIDSYLKEISKPLDTSKFVIKVLPFETDNNNERYKVVRQAVDDFIGTLKLSIPGVGKNLLNIWHNEIFKNGSKKDAALKLSKSDIIWPLIAIITDVERMDNVLSDTFDISLYDEIVFKYKEIIDSCCERCEFYIKVLYDYSLYKTTKNNDEKCIDFTLNMWGNYRTELSISNADKETERGLIQVILYNIVKNRIMIDRIKKEVRL